MFHKCAGLPRASCPGRLRRRVLKTPCAGGRPANVKAGVASEGDATEQVETLYTISDGWATDEFTDVASQLLLNVSTEHASAIGGDVPSFDSSSGLGEDDDDDEGFFVEDWVDEAALAKMRLSSGVEASDSGSGSDSDGAHDITAGASAQDDPWADEWAVEAVADDFEFPDGGSLDRGAQTSPSDAEVLSAEGSSDDEVDVREDAVERIMVGMQPHERKRIKEAQAESHENNAAMTPDMLRQKRKAKKRHIHLKLVAGVAAGKRLYSPADERTRPMMEKVRGALFSMLLAQTAGSNMFPENMRWLDLYAGTGAVGLESLSRGCAQAHFVEYDPWVISKVLTPNVETAGFLTGAVVHQDKVEDFLRRAASAPSFAGGAFDFVSVTPPYMDVSYPEIYDLLDASPLLHERSVVVVEYSAQNKRDIRKHVGPLVLQRDRKYGRTNLAIYAAA